MTPSRFLLAAWCAAIAPALPDAQTSAIRSTSGDPFLNVTDFGADGNDELDDTAAFQAALNAAMRETGSCFVGNTIVVPAGNYRISGTLRARNVRGLQIIGAGAGSTSLVWTDRQSVESFQGSTAVTTGLVPGASQVLFFLDGVQECLFQGFSVNNEANQFDAAFVVQVQRNGRCPSDANVWERITVDGGPNGVDRAFRFIADDENRPNGLENSLHTLRSVEVRNYLDAGFSLEHPAVRGVQFDACRFWGGDRGRAGVRTNLGVIEGKTNYGGSFRWFGGGGGQNVGADFELGDVSDTILVSGGTFQGSARFIHTGGPSGNQWPVIVESNVWLDDGLGAHAACPWPVAEQMRVVNFQFRGPLTMTGNQIGVPPDLFGPQVAKPAEIIWNPGNNFGQFVFAGNYLASTKANPFKGVTATGSSIGIYPTTMRDNIVETDDFGSSKVLPLEPTVTTLSGSATPTVRWLHTNRRLFKSGGGGPISNFLHGLVGQEIVILGSNGGRVIQSGSAIRLKGGVDLALGDDETVTLAMFDTGVWTEIARTAD